VRAHVCETEPDFVHSALILETCEAFRKLATFASLVALTAPPTFLSRIGAAFEKAAKRVGENERPAPNLYGRETTIADKREDGRSAN
jgi:hypothetical protein